MVPGTFDVHFIVLYCGQKNLTVKHLQTNIRLIINEEYRDSGLLKHKY
jgi:hypothetical protein